MPHKDVCDFDNEGHAKTNPSEAARQLQAFMKDNEVTPMIAPNIVVDGVWGWCSDKAFAAIFGEPLSQASLQKYLNVTCGEYRQFDKSRQAQSSCTSNQGDVVPNPKLATPEPQIPPEPEYATVFNPATAVKRVMASQNVRLYDADIVRSVASSKISPTLVATAFEKQAEQNRGGSQQAGQPTCSGFSLGSYCVTSTQALVAVGILAAGAGLYYYRTRG